MERAREGVAILLNDVWHSAAFECISSRILWIKFKSKLCGVGYGLNEGDSEEREGKTRTGLWIV